MGRHLDRLSSVDAGFLHQEDGNDFHMHIGGLMVLEGRPPSDEELSEHMEARLSTVPRYRQRLVYPPFGTGRPLWVDDPHFDIEYHVRRTVLPSPGSREQLLALVGRLFSQRLDRTHPLWELWLVEGLEGERFALVNKTHHALVDGVGGVDVMSAALDITPETRLVEPVAWRPQPEPSTLALLERGLRGLVRSGAHLPPAALGAAVRPDRVVGAAAGRALGLGSVARRLLSPAPPTPLNRRPGPHRRYAVINRPLNDLKAIKDALGGTVNDVILTAVATGLGRFLQARGVDTEGLVLRACVPMSLRTESSAGAQGNAITIMVADLPVGPMDATHRLALVRESLDSLKRSRQAVGARTLTEMENWLPPNILAQASRLSFSSHVYNVMVTNVPGPQFPIYLLGRQLLEAYPIAILARNHTVAIAALSYNGQISFGLLGDHDAVPDLDLLSKEIDLGVEELLAAAG